LKRCCWSAAERKDRAFPALISAGPIEAFEKDGSFAKFPDFRR